jgi:excisionase family DNA binding protein
VSGLEQLLGELPAAIGEVGAGAPRPADAPVELLSFDEAARRLGGVSVRTLRQQVRRGRGRVVRVGRRTLVPADALEEFTG